MKRDSVSTSGLVLDGGVKWEFEAAGVKAVSFADARRSLLRTGYRTGISIRASTRCGEESRRHGERWGGFDGGAARSPGFTVKPEGGPGERRGFAGAARTVSSSASCWRGGSGLRRPKSSLNPISRSSWTGSIFEAPATDPWSRSSRMRFPSGPASQARSRWIFSQAGNPHDCSPARVSRGLDGRREDEVIGARIRGRPARGGRFSASIAGIPSPRSTTAAAAIIPPEFPSTAFRGASTLKGVSFKNTETATLGDLRRSRWKERLGRSEPGRDYSVLNASISVTVMSAVAHLEWRNILDERYETFPGIPDGSKARSLRIHLEIVRLIPPPARSRARRR